MAAATPTDAVETTCNIIPEDTLNHLIRDLNHLKFRHQVRERNLDRKYKMSMNAINCIFRQNCTKKFVSKKSKIYQKKHQYYSEFKSKALGGKLHVLKQMAERMDYSPAMLGRMILEIWFKEIKGYHTDVREYLNYPDLIGNARMEEEINTVYLIDPNLGCAVESLKRLLGMEYEDRLQRYLTRAGVDFLTQEEMVKRGYDKTPDFKMRIPFTIGEHSVKWVESKALFGTRYSHEEYMKKQYLPYLNRFGPGLVIYWYGFVKELQDECPPEILLMDHFPGDSAHSFLYCPFQRRLQPRLQPLQKGEEDAGQDLTKPLHLEEVDSGVDEETLSPRSGEADSDSPAEHDLLDKVDSLLEDPGEMGVSDWEDFLKTVLEETPKNSWLK